jgi:cytohesin
MMSIRATIAAGLLCVPLFAGTALAADTGKLSLAEAAKQGNREVVASLLSKRGEEDLGGAEGTDALIWAATRNDGQMADLLLRAGADPKGANEYGATALYAAAASTDPAITVRLLAAGADPNAHLLSGETPLMEAARRGNLETVRAQEVNGGQTAQMWAISERHAAAAEALVRGGADIGTRSKRGSTALMFAAQQSDPSYTRMLLAAAANPNDVMPRTGLTPLIIASAMGHLEVATQLLDRNADPNAVGGDGYTSLHRAALDRTAVQVVKALLAHGAKPNVRLKQEKPTATTVNGVSLQGATPLLLAAEINNLAAVKALLEGGADPLIPTEKNTTPLMLAAGGGTDVVRPRSPRERATALQTVKLLVERGADPNGVGQFGWTPLHGASYQGLNDVIEFLVAKGAKLDAKDSFGQTPLSISYSIITKEIGSEVLQIPRILRQDTADLLLRLGATPLDRSGVMVVLQRNGG